MHPPQSLDLLEDLFGPEPLSPFSGGLRPIIEDLWILAALCELFSLVIKRSPFELKRLHRGIQPIALPKP